MRISGLVITLALAGVISIGAALQTDLTASGEHTRTSQITAEAVRSRSNHPLMRRSPAVRMILHQEVLGLPDHLKDLIRRMANG